MKNNRVIKKIRHVFEYVLLRVVSAAVCFLPRKLSLFLGAIVGHLLCFFSVYKKVVRTNFEHVGLWDAAQTKKIIPKLYVNMGRYAVDLLRGGMKDPVYRLHDYDIYENSRATTNKGTIIVLAHFGNWEMLAAIFGKQVDDLNVIAKPMGNPIVEKWLLKKRTSLNVKTIHSSNALRGMLSALKRNGITAILIDQAMGKMGTPTPFLGKTASTVRTVAGLMRKTGAAAIPVYAIMANDASYDIYFFKSALSSDFDGDEESAITAIQIQHNDIISDWIKKHPDHWFGWFHKRFKGYADYKN